MATASRNFWLRISRRKLRFTFQHDIEGRINSFSTKAVCYKDPKFDDIFPNVRKSSRLSAEEYARIERFVKKDLADPNEREDDENLSELGNIFMSEKENPSAYDNNNDMVSNPFWESVFDSSYNMKKLDAPEKPKKLKQTFMNMGEPEPWEEEGMLPDNEDDLTSLGHGELELHRELRHYARLAAWEMPLLYNLRKPYNPPTQDMPLRFRYTTYMGEQHPAENKVVLEFCPLDIPGLNNVQKDKLRKLAGVRWNPEKDVIKISCESYETQAQNKRYLGDVLASLLREAKDTTDSMIDIPLNTKHHSFKKIPQFPEEWIMTKKRKEELKKHRTGVLKRENKLKSQGLLIDGVQHIDAILSENDKTTNPKGLEESSTLKVTAEESQLQTAAVKQQM